MPQTAARSEPADAPAPAPAPAAQDSGPGGGNVGDAIDAGDARWSFGGNVAHTFEDHIGKSVPDYQPAATTSSPPCRISSSTTAR